MRCALRSSAGWSAAERLQRRASSCCRSSQWMTLGAWAPSTSLAGTSTQQPPSSSGGCGGVEGGGERGGSGAADDGAESSIAADHARGCGVGGRRERGMGEGKPWASLVVGFGGSSGGLGNVCSFSGERRRQLSVWFGLVWLVPGLASRESTSLVGWWRSGVHVHVVLVGSGHRAHCIIWAGVFCLSWAGHNSGTQAFT